MVGFAIVPNVVIPVFSSLNAWRALTRLVIAGLDGNRQIEAKAPRKLKHPSRSRKLRSFLDN